MTAHVYYNGIPVTANAQVCHHTTTDNEDGGGCGRFTLQVCAPTPRPDQTQHVTSYVGQVSKRTTAAVAAAAAVVVLASKINKYISCVPSRIFTAKVKVSEYRLHNHTSRESKDFWFEVFFGRSPTRVKGTCGRRTFTI